jgi:hypothetical protein
MNTQPLSGGAASISLTPNGFSPLAAGQAGRADRYVGSRFSTWRLVVLPSNRPAFEADRRAWQEKEAATEARQRWERADAERRTW